MLIINYLFYRGCSLTSIVATVILFQTISLTFADDLPANKAAVLIEQAEKIFTTDADSAKTLTFKALYISQTADDYKLISRSLNFVGLSYFYLRKIDSALIYYEKAENYATAHNVQQELANSFRFRGHIAYIKGDLEACEELYQKAIDIYEKEQVADELASAYSNMGMLLGKKGDFKRALAFYDHSLQVALQKLDMGNVSKTLLNMGTIHEEQGSYNDALKAYFRGVNIADSLGNEYLSGLLLNNIGVIYKSFGDYDIALSYFTKSLAIKQKSNNKRAVARTLGNIGNSYKYLEEYTKALSYLDSALNIFKEVDDPYFEAMTKDNIGSCYFYIANYDTAYHYYKDALAIAEKKNYEIIADALLYNIGRSYLQKSKKSEAKIAFTKSYTLAKQHEHNEFVRDAGYELYLLEKEAGNYNKALQYLEDYEIAKSALFSLQNTKDIMRQEARQQALKAKIKTEETVSAYRKEIDKYLLTNNVLILGIVALVIISILVYRLYGISNKAQKELSKKNQQIGKKNETIEIKNQQLKLQQKEILDFNKNLEQQVLNRTEELNERNQRLANFAFINSHKLRKHLSSILGIIDVLSSENLSPNLKKWLNHLDESAKSMDVVVHEINDMISQDDYNGYQED